MMCAKVVHYHLFVRYMRDIRSVITDNGVGRCVAVKFVGLCCSFDTLMELCNCYFLFANLISIDFCAIYVLYSL